jgi:diguanylate cyclase (GGDEF)-like protein
VTELDFRTRHDPLTGLGNRTLFYDQLGHAVDLHRRDLRSAAVIMCDIDDFKAINDTRGHAAGDEVLVWLGERLRSLTRAGDTVARLGGDEFAVIIEDGGDPTALADRLLAATATPVTVAGTPLRVSVSLGIATLEVGDRASAEDLVVRADLALYESKRRGKSTVSRYRPDLAPLPER